MTGPHNDLSVARGVLVGLALSAVLWAALWLLVSLL